MTETLGDMFESVASQHRAESEAEGRDAKRVLAHEKKRQAERERAIRNGWIDEDGNSLLPPDDEEDEEDL